MRLSAFGEWDAGRSAAGTDSGPMSTATTYSSTLSLSEAVTGDVSAGADAVNRMAEIIGFRQAGGYRGSQVTRVAIP